MSYWKGLRVYMSDSRRENMTWQRIAQPANCKGIYPPTGQHLCLDEKAWNRYVITEEWGLPDTGVTG